MERAMQNQTFNPWRLSFSFWLLLSIGGFSPRLAAGGPSLAGIDAPSQPSQQKKAGPFAIAYGDTYSGTINNSVDTFSFQAIAGDRILLYMGTNGTLGPDLKLYDPNGDLVASDFELYPGLAQFSVKVSLSGTYSIRADGRGNNESGTYELYLNRLNNPVDAIPFNFGETYHGTIYRNSNLFSVSALAGDQLLLTMGTSGNLGPQLQLYDPNGDLVASDYDFYPGLAQFSAKVSITGVYSILADDATDDGSGNYTLYLNRLNNPVDAIPFNFGETYHGTIYRNANLFSVSALAGDQLFLTMGTSGSLGPQLQLYDPSGDLVASDYELYPGLAQFSAKVSITGAYSILADDATDDGSGNYTLYLNRLNNPADAIPINFGETHHGIISRNANLFSFDAVAGDKLSLTMSTSGRLGPDLRLQNPLGDQIAHDFEFYAGLAQFTVSAPLTGTYSIRADDAGDDDSGEYILSLNRLNNPPNVPLSIVITEPTPGPSFTSELRLISLAGSAHSQATVEKVTWSNNRGGEGVATGTNRWTIEEVALRPGDNTVTVTVHAAGQTASDSLSIYYPKTDQNSPIVTIVIPTAEETYETDRASINLSGIAEDENEILSVDWENDRGGSGSVSGITTWSVNNIALKPGINSITISARDESDNEGSDTLRVNYRPPGGANVFLPDPAFKAYLVDSFDTDQDGEISFTEAETLQTIDAPNLGITTLEGVENFRALTSLSVPNNAIATLPNLAGLTLLTNLNLANNQLSGSMALPTSLKEGHFFGNQLDVPPNIEGVENLNLLDLRRNLLDTGDCAALLSMSQQVPALFYSPQSNGKTLVCGEASDRLAIVLPTIQDRISVIGDNLSELHAAFQGDASQGAITWRTDSGANGFTYLQTQKTDGQGNATWRAFDIPLKQGENTIWVEATDETGNRVIDSIQIYSAAPSTEPPQSLVKFPNTTLTSFLQIYEIQATPGTYPIDRIEWDFDGKPPFILFPDESGLSFTTSHAFNEPGVYTVRALIFDTQDFYKEERHQIVVQDLNIPPNLEALRASSLATKVGTDVTFTAVATDQNQDDLSYFWLFSLNGTQVYDRWTRSSVMNYGFPEPGHYTITVIVSDSDKFVTGSINVSVEDVATPTLHLDPPGFVAAYCLNQSSNASTEIQVSNLTGGQVNYQTEIFYLDDAAKPWVRIDSGAMGTVRFGENANITKISLQNTESLDGGRTYQANLVFSDINGIAPERVFNLNVYIDKFPCANRVQAVALSKGTLAAEWLFHEEDIESFEAMLQPSNSSEFIQQMQTTNTSAVFTKLEDNRHYRLIVQAKNQNGVVSTAETWQKTISDQPQGFATYFNHIAQNSGFWTGIALLNPHTTAVDATLIARNAEGTIVSLDELQLPAGHKRLGTVNDFFTAFDSTSKSLEVRADKPLVSLELFGSNDQQRMTGLPTNDHLIYTGHMVLGRCQNNGAFATFGLFNPLEEPLSIEFEGFDDLGNLVGFSERVLLPKSQMADCAEGLFSEDPPALATVRLRGSGPFTGFALWGDGPENMNGDAFLQSGALETLLPRVEPGGFAYIANPTDTTIHVNVAGFDDQGNQVLQDSHRLNPRQRITLPLQFEGSLKLSSSHPLLVTSELNRAGPNRFSEAITGQTETYNALIMPHVGNSAKFRTEVFIVNAANKRTFFTVEAFSKEGQTLGESNPIELPAHGGYRVDVRQVFPNQENIAYLKILGRADSQLVGQGLFSTHPHLGGQMGGFVLSPLSFE